jgi:endogenous inhibitor of DNA gyrase (YacG/DUF329 family)
VSEVRVPCPLCGKVTVADESRPLSPSFPFCSERCRLVDLGKWYDEEYRVSKPAVPPGVDAADEPPSD